MDRRVTPQQAVTLIFLSHRAGAPLGELFSISIQLQRLIFALGMASW